MASFRLVVCPHFSNQAPYRQTGMRHLRPEASSSKLALGMVSRPLQRGFYSLTFKTVRGNRLGVVHGRGVASNYVIAILGSIAILSGAPAERDDLGLELGSASEEGAQLWKRK